MYEITKVFGRIFSLIYYTFLADFKKKCRQIKGLVSCGQIYTETGREVTSVYTVEDSKQRYEIGAEEMVCYDPDDPMFFYFSSRQEDLYKDYFRLIVFGGAIAALLTLFVIIK